MNRSCRPTPYRRLSRGLRRAIVGITRVSGSPVRATNSPAATSRGQSEILGTVLILGLSFAVIGSTLVLGGSALADITNDAESANVENSMSHFSSKVSLVALGDSESQRFALGSTRSGTVSVQPTAGEVSVYHVVNQNRELKERETLGAVVYQGTDREIAYQGGGIWANTATDSRLVSPPEYHYRGTTLTLPIIQVSGEGAVGGSARGEITPVSVGNRLGDDIETPLENGTIEVHIQSDYYQGWYEFLSQRAAGSTWMDHDNQTVISELTVPDEVSFERAVSVRSTYSASGNAGVEEDQVEDEVTHRSARPLIANKIDETRDDNDNNGCVTETGIDESCTLTTGTYFVGEDVVLDDNLDIDTSDGNVTLVVDGSFDIQNHNVTVTDTETDNGVTYYINDSLRANGNGYVGTDSPAPEPARNVFFVGDQVLDESSGGGTITFEAIIYAPDADVISNGNADIIGSIIANSLDIGGNFQISYDESLSDTVIEITGAANQLTYIHLSHNEVAVQID